MLAAPGLMSPMMQQLGTYLAQPATSNDFLPQISQPNFGGLFGTPTTPAPFTQTAPPSFIGNILGNTPWQGSQFGPSAANTMFGAPNPSGGLNFGAMPPRGTRVGGLRQHFTSSISSMFGGGGQAGGPRK
jgi:hypothetical protein